jgi:hypothetical protein
MKDLANDKKHGPVLAFDVVASGAQIPRSFLKIVVVQ